MSQSFDFRYRVAEDEVINIFGYDPSEQTTLRRVAFVGMCPECSQPNGYAVTIRYNPGMDLPMLLSPPHMEASGGCGACTATVQLFIDHATLP